MRRVFVIYFNENYNSVMQEPLNVMDKRRLIAEIQKRPTIWDYHRLDRTFREITKNWKEVARVMGYNVSVNDCKKAWKNLRNGYREGIARYYNCILRHKLAGKYDPVNKKYGSTWMYHDEMNFLAKFYKPKGTYASKFPDLIRSGEHEIKSLKRKSTTNHCLRSEAKSSSIGNDRTQSIDDDDAVNVRIEVDSDNEYEMESYPIDQEESINVLSTTSEEESIKDEEEILLNPVKENQNVSAKCSQTQYITDPDNNYLISYSSYMKSMSQLQNLQFRAKMSDLILSIVKTSSHSSDKSKPLENKRQQLKAFLDVSDSDCYFLISFLPYMKLMTHLENLELRVKISEIMLDVLSE